MRYISEVMASLFTLRPPVLLLPAERQPVDSSRVYELTRKWKSMFGGDRRNACDFKTRLSGIMGILRGLQQLPQHTWHSATEYAANTRRSNSSYLTYYPVGECFNKRVSVSPRRNSWNDRQRRTGRFQPKPSPTRLVGNGDMAQTAG